MSDQSAMNRAVTYVRDMSGDGPNQVNLIGQPRPAELQRLMEAAGQDDRNFDVVVVASEAVLGRPERVQDIVHEFAAMGVRVEFASGQAPRE